MMNRQLAIFAVLALTGCAHFDSRPLAPEKTAAQLGSRRFDDPGLKTFFAQNTGHTPETWPLEQWDLNSLTIPAFYFHPALDPTLAVTPQYNTTTLVPSPWGPSVSLDLPIETAGKRGKRIAEAEKLSESARLSFVSAAWQIRSGVRVGLLDYGIAERRLPLLQKQLASQREIVRLMQGSFDAGETSRPKLTTAQMALNKIQLDASAAEAKSVEARSRLAEALGVTTAALEGIQLPVIFSADVAGDLTSDAARHAALVGRADIRAALADYAAAENDLRLEIAKQYPDVHLNPGYQYDQGDNKWSVGLSFDLPVFNQNQGPIAESRARRELAAAKFLQLQVSVIAQVERAVADWQSAQAQMKTSDELSAAAGQQQKSIAAQVLVGAATKMDLASAEIDLNSVRLAQFDSEAQVQSAISALEDALQSPADSIAAVIEKISTDTPKGKVSHP
ncbi:MAG: TolC family protein [Verrucomicrobia bacterium]|nr:TolC family protein [Verrucomicrobiota bacterium]